MKYCSKCGGPMGDHDKVCTRCMTEEDKELRLARKLFRTKLVALVSTILVIFTGFLPWVRMMLLVGDASRSILRYDLYISYALIVTGVLAVVAVKKEAWEFSIFCGFLAPIVAGIISWVSGGLFFPLTFPDGLREAVYLILLYFIPNIVLIGSSYKLLIMKKKYRKESDYTIHYRRLQKITCNDEQTMV
ncbi:MAG: hypothetical protein IKS10_03735 [Lachnospiraceae bacterium]|nr:hypothetical protein [Lachnospiraceae bacterium]